MPRVALVVMLAACSDPAAVPDAGLDRVDAPFAKLVVSPVGHDFGDYAVGSGEPPLRFTFEVGNTGTLPADAISAAFSGSAAADFTLEANDCGAMLAPGETCNVRVAFAASAAGERSIMMVIVAGNGTGTDASLSGTGLAPLPRIRFEPPSRNFGDVPVGGTSGLVAITVFNESASTTLTSSLSGPDTGGFRIASTDCTGATIPLHGTCTLMIELAPTVGGQFIGDVVLTDTGGTEWKAGITGVSTTPLAITPYTGLFQSMLVGQTQPGDRITFTVKNTGATVTNPITATPIGAAAADFTVQSTTCTTLMPDETCTVIVELTATTRGAKLAQLAVTDTVTEARSTLRGDAYSLLVVGVAMFPDTASGQQSATHNYVVINASDRATGAITTTRGGTDPTQFAIVSDGCAAGLAAHTQCAIVIRFEPTTTGAKAASLNVAATPGGSDSFAITGLGI